MCSCRQQRVKRSLQASSSLDRAHQSAEVTPRFDARGPMFMIWQAAPRSNKKTIGCLPWHPELRSHHGIRVRRQTQADLLDRLIVRIIDEILDRLFGGKAENDNAFGWIAL